MMLWLVVAVVWLAAGLLTYSFLGTLFAEERMVARRLRRLTDYEAEQARSVEPLLAPFVDRVIRPTLSGSAHVARMLSPGDYRERLRSRMDAAGRPRGMTVDRFLAAKVLTALGTFLALAFFGVVGRARPGSVAFLVIVLTPVAFYAPDLWLKNVVDNRRLAIRRAMPDMLDMLTISVESGLGFDAAVAKLVSVSSGPLSEEMGRMLQEVQAGMSRRDALKHMADRVDVRELDTFVTAMIQAEVFGVPTTRVLRTQSDEMRIRRRQFAEEQAQKAPVKVVFPLVLCVLPATLIVFAGPAAVTIAKAFGMIGG
jgi:tight adherence protein C